MNLDSQKRVALEEHWQASERGETENEHSIYSSDARCWAISSSA
jgi:hypothetical protein